VKAPITTAQRFRKPVRMANVSFDKFGPGAGQPVQIAPAAKHRSHGMSASAKLMNEVSADETAGSCHKTFHGCPVMGRLDSAVQYKLRSNGFPELCIHNFSDGSP
jgi:hypothetical protein